MSLFVFLLTHSLRPPRRRQHGRRDIGLIGLHLENLRVLVHARINAQTNGAADGLGHLALVDRAQTSLGGMLDPAHGSDELGDEGEVL
jgi:hypothetical protein